MRAVTFNPAPRDLDSLAPRERDLLLQLAKECRVATWYTGQDGNRVDVSLDTVLFALRELGLNMPDTPDEAALIRATNALTAERMEALVEPTITALADTPRTVEVHCIDGDAVRVWIQLEGTPSSAPSPIECAQTDAWVPPVVIDATTYGTATFALPALPAGWHTLHVETTGPTGTRQADSTLLVSPARFSAADRFAKDPATGVMAQLYSVRDAEAWGIGDYRTLQKLGHALHELGGADFILVNPMHAAEAAPPVEDSPYLPTTRRYTNPLYIRVEDTPEYRAHPELREAFGVMKEKLSQANGTAEELDRSPAVASKIRALHMLWSAGIGDERLAELRRFQEREGEGLAGFTEWCANAARAYGVRENMELSADFFAWVQMLCQEQELAAQTSLTQHMRIGLMADLAVGVHPGGADSQILADVLAPRASVGAPPDGYNQQGQDWSQPPWHPWKLAQQGYKPWRDMLRTILRSSGGIRVDHVLGLFRLWWIPRMSSPTTGTYVSYDHEALIGALVLEAERAGAVVIGEDLGTFEPWVQDYLASRGVMGTSIVWFEGDEGGAKSPDRYRELALTSVTTHDLPPTASYLRGGHIDLREQLGVLTRSTDAEYAEDAQWQEQVLSTIGHSGAFDGLPCAEYFQPGGGIDGESERPREGRENRPGGPDGLDGACSSGIIEGMHRFLAMTPSALKCVALVDMVGDLRAQNQPGTTHELYPNWCIPLCDHQGRAVMVEDLPKLQLARDVLAAARGE